MANLLNAIPQASNNAVSSLDQNPAKSKGSELKELFQQTLSENLAGETSGEKTAENLLESPANLGEVALAAGAVTAPKADPIDLRKVGTSDQPAEAVKNFKAKDQALQSELMKKAELSLVGDSKNPMNEGLVSMIAGQDLMSLSEEHEFDLESVDLKNVVSEGELPKAASSKLSTSDFLNLREISQNISKPKLMAAATSPGLTDAAQLAPLPVTGAVIGMKPTLKQKENDRENLDVAMGALAPAHGDREVFGKTMDAMVSQTNGQKPVLTPESITQIGNQVNLLGKARQDGEVKIRLRPDHLGELQMSVRTQGQNVMVQIRAENSEAKKIIEDSLSSLREHLSQQNLSLAKIEVVTQPAAASNLDQSQMQFDSNQNFNQSFANQGERNGSQDSSQQSGRNLFEDMNFSTAKPSTITRAKVADSTRLDLIA